MDFSQFNLDTRLAPAIKRAGFYEPTPIQIAAIPLAMAGRDLIGTAQTGTGKTAAFMLPILHKLLNSPGKGTRVLIVTPTRELAEQIHETTKKLSAGTKIRSVTVYGGVGPAPQIEALKQGTEIVVACPGRLLDHLQNNQAKLRKVEILVLDEADRMLDMGFLPDIKRILNHIPKDRQTMLFSATFPKEIEQLAGQTLRNPKRVAIGLARPAYTVDHTLYPVPHHLKNRLLIKLLDQTDTKSILIFTRTKHRAQNLLKKIKRTKYKATSLHGDRTQGQRRQALNGFRDGKYQIMVATDIAARGLDIDGISHVINFDMPDTIDAYTHRIGRTGRAYETGQALTFAMPEDEPLVRDIEKVLKKRIDRRRMPGFDYAGFDPDKSARQNGTQGARGNGRKPQNRGNYKGHNSRSTGGSNRGRSQWRKAHAAQGNGN
jgi:ATP-dependent RNA helicase RhlE